MFILLKEPKEMQKLNHSSNGKEWDEDELIQEWHEHIDSVGNIEGWSFPIQCAHGTVFLAVVEGVEISRTEMRNNSFLVIFGDDLNI
mmetsp:Transcript_10996/g.23833  ORF Transcript_10996/g.23833 Transcript_10996/m.23833 type:complete len:87 (+) Transcript_10996:1170-1430(+)